MADVKIKYNERDLRRVQDLLQAVPNKMPQVMSRGINKTTASARTRISRELAAKTKMTQSVIRNSLRLYKATYYQWWSRISFSVRGISLLRLKPRQTKKGVSYVDPRTSARTLMHHAFIQTVPHGGKGVFKRLSIDRLPIEKLYAPSLSEIYNDAPAVAARIQKETGKDLHKNVMTQVRLVLDKARKR